MKKITLLCIVCYILLKPCIAQTNTNKERIIFHDAVFLYEHLTPKAGGPFLSSTNDSISAILKYYFPDGEIKGNPFMIPFIPDGKVASQVAIGATFKNIASSIGGLDVTNIADGLARFLVKRGKEELNVAFFQRMKEFLDKNIEARTLFPATSHFLGTIASYRYAELLQSLREAFYKDLKNLIVNLNQLIDLPKYKNLLAALPEIRVAIRSAKIVSELSQAESSLHPATLIHSLAYLQEWHEMDINLENSWKLLDIISQSVRRLDTQSIVWINFSDFHGKILKDSNAVKIFLGLLYQKTENISFKIKKDTISVQEFMRGHVDDILSISNLIENFLLLANDIDQTAKELHNISLNKLSNDDYYNYIDKAVNIVEYGFKVANSIKPGVADDRYIVLAKNANELYKNIFTKNYNAAIMNTYLILDGIFTSENIALEKKEWFIQMGELNALVKTEGIRFNHILDSLIAIGFFKDDSLLNRSKTIERILKYGNLMASIVKAETAQEAEAAIEAAVLPVGSSSIKKNTKWNISLNAYIGGYYSNYVNNTDKIDGSNSKIGLTAPIGVAFSKSLPGKKSSSAISAFFTLFDVGAIAGYRLNDDSTELEQKITLDNIFTPGAYLVYGLPWNLPISIGVGGQYGSKLYKVEPSGTLSISDQSRWRWSAFIGVDIPLVNFATANRRKKSN